MILAGGDVVGAGQSRVAEVAGVERLLEAKIRRLYVLRRQIGGQIVRHDDGIVSLIEVCQVAAEFGEAWEDLPAQAVAQSEPAAALVFILTEEAVLPSRSGNVRAGNRKENSCREPFKKVAKGIAGKCVLKRKLPKIVGRQEGLDVGIAHPARVNAGLQGVLAPRPGQIVRELSGLRLRHSRLVAANRSESGSGTEIESRKGVRGGVLADVYAGQVELRERVCALDGEADAGDDIREAEAEFVQQPRCEGPCMRNQQAAIMHAVGVIRQQWVGIVFGDVLAAETRVHRLLC